MSNLSIFSQILLGKIQNKCICSNIEAFLSGVIKTSSTKIFTFASDAKEFDRIKNALSGKSKNGITPEMCNEALLEQSISNIDFNSTLFVIHDGSNILKPESKFQSDLCKVQDLDKVLVNGYVTFNTICVDDKEKKIHLLQSKLYSTNDSGGFNQSMAGFTEREIMEEQVKKVDIALKEKFPDVNLIHIFDRKHDDKNWFSFVSDLDSSFVIRIKLNRNSNETTIEERENKAGEKKPKEVTIKLVNANLCSKKEIFLEKFVWKNKTYKNAKLVSSYGTLLIDNITYYVVKTQVYQEDGKKIFKEPMLLMTNIKVESHEKAFEIYQFYLIRSKIESVFKFLKQELGWEDFRVRNFLAIQNIVVLCFFVAEYFYEQEDKLSTDEQVIFLCKLAKSKGKITKHFYLKGLVIAAHYLLFLDYVKENNLSEREVQELIASLS